MDASASWHGLMALLPITWVCGCAPGQTTPKEASDLAPLVIKGYDPVAYFNVGPGKPEFEYEWDEQRYRFANAENMARFKADPARYAPRFGNNCAGALAYGLPFKADPEIWRIHEGRLYIFGSTGSRDDFDRDPKRVLAAAERNYDRLRSGQPLAAELPLPASAVAFFTAGLEQCRKDPRANPYCGTRDEENVRYILDHQPAIRESALPGTTAAQP
jgi:YHS domain-containing protein